MPIFKSTIKNNCTMRMLFQLLFDSCNNLQSTMTNSEFSINLWKLFICPDELFLNFYQYCDEQREVMKCSSTAFKISISKYHGLKADVRDRITIVIR